MSASPQRQQPIHRYPTRRPAEVNQTLHLQVELVVCGLCNVITGISRHSSKLPLLISQNTTLTEQPQIYVSHIGQRRSWILCNIVRVVDTALEVHYNVYASCPCRVPLIYLRETKKFVVPELPEAPLIVFINSRSGGRAGPKLAETLFHALGHSQV